MPPCASLEITGVLADGSAFNVNVPTVDARLPLASILFMPHPIIQIDELLRLVIGELIGISPRAAVSFAVTCRSLEEPTLSSLWKQQYSLPDLVKVLPNHTCVKDERGVELSVVSDRDFPADQVLMSIHPGD